MSSHWLLAPFLADAPGRELGVPEAEDALVPRADEDVDDVARAVALAGALDAGEELVGLRRNVGLVRRTSPARRQRRRRSRSPRSRSPWPRQ
jgi:hypothetical protein